MARGSGGGSRSGGGSTRSGGGGGGGARSGGGGSKPSGGSRATGAASRSGGGGSKATGGGAKSGGVSKIVATARTGGTAYTTKYTQPFVRSALTPLPCWLEGRARSPPACSLQEHTHRHPKNPNNAFYERYLAEPQTASAHKSTTRIMNMKNSNQPLMTREYNQFVAKPREKDLADFVRGALPDSEHFHVPCLFPFA